MPVFMVPLQCDKAHFEVSYITQLLQLEENHARETPIRQKVLPEGQNILRNSGAYVAHGTKPL